MSDSTLTGAIDLGDFPDEVVEVVERLRDLPDFDLRIDLRCRLEVFRRKCRAAVKLADDARAARRSARETAHALVESVRGRWSTREIKKATGYIP